MVGAKGPRKLLIASVGVATINYVAGCDAINGHPTSGNLPAPHFAGQGGGGAPVVANLPAPMGGFPPLGGSAGQPNAGVGGAGAGAGGSQGGSGGKPANGGAGGNDGAGGDGLGGDSSSGGAGGAP